MTMITALSSLLWVVMTLMMTPLCDGATLIDLTHPLKKGETVAWPTTPDFNFSIVKRDYNRQFDIWYELNEFSMAEHVGTHMDAPSHMSKGKWRMQDIPTDRFSGPGVVVNVSEKVKSNELYQVTAEDFKDWESEHGQLPEKGIVLVYFGWGSRYPDNRRVFNTNNLKDPTTYKFPTISEEAARWLAEERNIGALGMDTPTPDRGNDFRLPAHKLLFAKNILIIEQVANLDSLPPTGTTIILGALKIHDGSGAPLRLFAFSGDWRSGPSAVCLAAALSVGMMMLKLL